MQDILFQISGYPEPTPPTAIEQAVRFAAVVGGKLTALAVHADIRVPDNALANYLIGLNRLAVEEEARSRQACEQVLSDFAAAASAGGVLGDTLLKKAELFAIEDVVAVHARTRDLCIVPVGSGFEGQRAIAEAVIFGSGRPVLLFRPGETGLATDGLKTVVLAWDGSRTSARAMADALPLLKAAGQVRVLTVLGEKPEARRGMGADAVRHLQTHGVAAVADEVNADNRPIGTVLDAYNAANGADLLVMGAYGRSRIREFVLGGATRHMIDDPKTPLLMSH
ncbi:MAG: universal stress protein [Caulobacter sp.]|nr:universal stress protein [Caulobacter sp.]